ncbi:hypothetical protein GC175_33800 [bacterium]|nr:hypothetical protein [bacterium]
MKAIEQDVVISAKGRLPAAFQEAFGRKVRVIILIEEEAESVESPDTSAQLMGLAGKISAFRHMDDPVAVQRAWRGVEELEK